MTLGEKIRACRRKAGLTQEQLAEAVGVSRQAVTKWEQNQSAPGTAHLMALAQALSLPAGELLDHLAVLGAELLSKTLTRFESGKVPATPQDASGVSYAPMLDKSMCPIDWTRTAQQVHNHVRGLHPWPVATMELQGKTFKVHATRVVEGSGKPGEILGLTKTGLRIACGEGAVEIISLQAEGGKRMAAPDYFRGHPLER